MTGFPIPAAALDDRLAIVGTAGSGKTYLTMGAIEHLFARKARVIAVDPLGVMWGLRLCADGKSPSPYQPVIFGGAHGDLPINEHAGALIGQAIATSPESCIIDLSQLGTKAAERRFMLALLTALYRDTNREPVHLIVDEADMFAPQSVSDKEGEAVKLLGMMETIVRRGRVRGFIPWLITQRPAVLNKNVLSQADGLVAMKLTSSQDRDQLGDWVKGQADVATWKAMYGELATYQRGEGLVWLPARGILQKREFPPKATFDSSRTPKRGERQHQATLKPIDLTALRSKLGKVEEEAKANDPKALKTEIARLQGELRKAQASTPVENLNSTAALKDRERAFEAGKREGREGGYRDGWLDGERGGFSQGVAAAHNEMNAALKTVASVAYVPGTPPKRIPAGESTSKYIEVHSAPVVQRSESRTSTAKMTGSSPAGRSESATAEGLSRPQQRILDALAWLSSIGIERADRPRVAMLADASHRSSGFEKNVSTLRTAGFVSYPSSGELALTSEGDRIAHAPTSPPTTADLHAAIRQHVSGPQWNILAALADVYPESLTREELASRASASALSSGFEKNVSTMRSFGFVDYPDKGHVVATPIMFVGVR